LLLRDLPTAILLTKEEIEQLKLQLKEITDPQEKRRLRRRIKELQHLQLWQMDKLKNAD
jgi:PHD/YefM family antitoxin component YafN of YafNO toxin-antitoxin module